MEILFTKTFEVSESFMPKPASNFLPEWYKNTEPLIGNKFDFSEGGTPYTIKKCLPVFDSITAGYIITTYVDVQIKNENGYPYYYYPSQNPINFHPIEQAKNHPYSNNHAYPKWVNPWAIKTPIGYSCMFLPPMHRENKIFSIMPGIVDTDLFTCPVNFPFVLNDPLWEGIIPAGTPIVQVIPFKRDSWKINYGKEKDFINQEKVIVKLRSMFANSYKKQFWNKKEYK